MEWSARAIANMIEGLKEYGAWLYVDRAAGWFVIVVPKAHPNGRELLITRPTFDAPGHWLYEIDLDSDLDSRIALFTDDGDAVKYVKQIASEPKSAFNEEDFND